MSKAQPFLVINNKKYSVEKQLGTPGLFASAFLLNGDMEKIVVKFIHPSWLKNTNTEIELIGKFVRESIILSYLEEKGISDAVKLKGVSFGCVNYALPEDREHVQRLANRYACEKADVDFLLHLLEVAEGDINNEKGFISSKQELERIAAEGFPYLALEYIDDNYESLRQLTSERNTLDTGESIEICFQFLNMLRHIHTLNIAYLDIKEDHIFWNGKNIKVIDWNASALKNDPLDSRDLEDLLSKQKQDVDSFAKIMYHLFSTREYVALAGNGTSWSSAITLANVLAHSDSDTSLQFWGRENLIPFSIQAILEKGLSQNPEKMYKDSVSMFADIEMARTSFREWGDARRLSLDLIMHLSQKAEGKRAQGIPLLKNNLYADALVKFKEALFFTPSFVSLTYYMESLLRANEHNVTAGEMAFARSVLEDSEYASAIEALKKNKSRELYQFSRALENMMILLSQAQSHKNNGNVESAIDAYINVLANDSQCKLAKEGLEALITQQNVILKIRNAIENEQIDVAKHLILEIPSNLKNSPALQDLESEIQFQQYYKRAQINFQNDRFALALEDVDRALQVKFAFDANELRKKLSDLVEYEKKVESEFDEYGDYEQIIAWLKIMEDLSPNSQKIADLRSRASNERAIYQSINSLFIEASEKNTDLTAARKSLKEALGKFDNELKNKAFSNIKHKVKTAYDKVNHSLTLYTQFEDALSELDFKKALSFSYQINKDIDDQTNKANRVFQRIEACRSRGEYAEIHDLLGEFKSIDVIKNIQNRSNIDNFLLSVSAEYDLYNKTISSIQRGIDKLEDGSWDEAEVAFQSAVASANEGVNIEYLSRSRSQAYEHYETFLEFKTFLSKVHSLPEVETRIYNLEKCLEIYPKNEKLQTKLADAKQQKEDQQRGEEILSEIRKLYKDQNGIQALFEKTNSLSEALKSKIGDIVVNVEQLYKYFTEAEKSLREGKYFEAGQFVKLFREKWPNSKDLEDINNHIAQYERKQKEIDKAYGDAETRWRNARSIAELDHLISFVEKQIKSYENNDKLLRLLLDIQSNRTDVEEVLGLYDKFEHCLNVPDFIGAHEFASKLSAIISGANGNTVIPFLSSAKKVRITDYEFVYPKIQRARAYDDKSKLEDIDEAYRLYKEANSVLHLPSLEAQVKKLEERIRSEHKFSEAIEAFRRKDFDGATFILRGENSPKILKFLNIVKMAQRVESARARFDYDELFTLLSTVLQDENSSEWIPENYEQAKNNFEQLQQRENDKKLYDDLIENLRVEDAAALLKRMLTSWKNDNWASSRLSRLDDLKTLSRQIAVWVEKRENFTDNYVITKSILSTSKFLKKDEKDVVLLLGIYNDLMIAWDAFEEGEIKDLEPLKKDKNKILPCLKSLKELHEVSVDLYDKCEELEEITRKVDNLIALHRYDEALRLIDSKETASISKYLKNRRLEINNTNSKKFGELIEKTLNALNDRRFDEAISLRSSAVDLSSKNPDLNFDLKALDDKFADSASMLVLESKGWHELHLHWVEDLISFLQEVFEKNLKSKDFDTNLLSESEKQKKNIEIAFALDPRIAHDYQSKILLQDLAQIHESVKIFLEVLNLVCDNKTGIKQVESLLQDKNIPPKLSAALISFVSLFPVFEKTSVDIVKFWEKGEIEKVIKVLSELQTTFNGHNWLIPERFLEQLRDSKHAQDFFEDGRSLFNKKYYEKAQNAFQKFNTLYEKYNSTKSKNVLLGTYLKDCEKQIYSANRLIEDFYDALKENNYKKVASIYHTIQTDYPFATKIDRCRQEVEARKTELRRLSRTYAEKSNYKESVKNLKLILLFEPVNDEIPAEIKKMQQRVDEASSLKRRQLTRTLTLLIGGLLVFLGLVFAVFRMSPIPPDITPTATHRLPRKTSTPDLDSTPTMLFAETPYTTNTSLATPTPTVTLTVTFLPVQPLSYPTGVIKSSFADLYDMPDKKEPSGRKLFKDAVVFVCGTYIDSSPRMYLVGRNDCSYDNLQGWVQSLRVEFQIDDLFIERFRRFHVTSLENSSIEYYDEHGKRSGLEDIKPEVSFCDLKTLTNVEGEPTDKLISFSRDNCQSTIGWLKLAQVVLIIPPVESKYPTPTPIPTRTATPTVTSKP
jgi:serine/threonine protein kinase